MNIKKGDFIEVDYTARIKENNRIFDTTDEATAKASGFHDKNINYHSVIICIGNNEIIPGLDSFLIGKELNKEYNIELKPHEAFGDKNSKMYQLVNTSKFLKQNIKPYPGLHVNIDNAFGIVKTVSGGRTMVDFNHPLAGKEVIYKIKVNRIVTETNEKVKAYLHKIIGSDVKYNLTNNKLTIEYKLSKSLQPIIAEQLKRIITEIEGIEFKTDNKE